MYVSKMYKAPMCASARVALSNIMKVRVSSHEELDDEKFVVWTQMKRI